MTLKTTCKDLTVPSTVSVWLTFST